MIYYYFSLVCVYGWGISVYLYGLIRAGSTYPLEDVDTDFSSCLSLSS